MQLKLLKTLSADEALAYVEDRRRKRQLTLNKPPKRLTVSALASAWNVDPATLSNIILEESQKEP